MAQNIYATRFDRAGGSYNPYIAGSPGFSDGANLTFSIWFKPNSPFNGSRLARFPNGGLLYITNTNQLNLTLEDTGGALCRKLITTGAGFNSGSWNHFAFSIAQGAEATAKAALNGALESNWSDYVGNNFDLSSGNFAIAGTANSFDGCISEVFIEDQYIDLSVAGNLAKLIVSGKAADLGANGENVFAGTPAVYLRGQYPNEGINYGTGGDFSEVTGAQISECSDAPTRDSGSVLPIVMEYTTNELTGIQESYLGTAAAAADQVGGFSSTFALAYVRPATTSGEIETLIWADPFDSCNFGVLDNNVPINSLYCGGAFGVGEISGTISSKLIQGTDRYCECRQTYDQANTLGNNHTMIEPRVGVWTDNNRRLDYRTHYRWKTRVRLGPDFQIATPDNWDILAQIKYGNIGEALLNAPGGGNPTIAIGANRADGKYDVAVRGSPIFGGPLVQGDFTTAPSGYNVSHTGGNYFADVGIWREWVIDFFNCNDPDGPDPGILKDGFFKLTIGGQVIVDVKDEWIGLWFLDSATRGAEGYTQGVYKYPARYLDRDVCTMDIDRLEIYEVTQGGSGAVQPFSVSQGEFSGAASGVVRYQQKGNAIVSVGITI